MPRQTEISTGVEIAKTIIVGIITLFATSAVMIWIVVPKTPSSDEPLAQESVPPPNQTGEWQPGQSSGQRGRGTMPVQPVFPPPILLPQNIFEAAEKGTVQDIENYVGTGTSMVNQRDERGDTPLHYAAWYNPNAEVVKYLVSKGADVNSKGSDGYTALHGAASHNSNVDVLRYLISQKADISARDNKGNTPLEIANTEEKKRILREAMAAQPRTTTPLLSVMPGLEGIWRQHINGSAAGDFVVKIDRETGRYEMSLIQRNNSLGFTNTRGISNIQYDGTTWSFDSDWGNRIGKFVLKKVNNNTFEGLVEGSQNRWVRVDATPMGGGKLPYPARGTTIPTGRYGLRVEWSAVNNARSYRVQYATNAAFTTGVRTVNSTTTSANITGLSADRVYYVRVMAVGSGDFTDSDYSPTSTARTAR